jgi:dihydroorotase-like cyclic amidohydrolase
MLSEGVNKGRITLPKLVEVCSTNVAKTFGLFPKKGALEVGSDADITIVDLEKKHTISASTHHSIAGYNLYEGIEFTGWPTTTIVRGEVVMKDDSILAKPGFGQYQRRELGKKSWREAGLLPGLLAVKPRDLPSPLPVI